MDFRILGPLEVIGPSGAVPLGGRKARAVLTVLLLHPNRPVGAEQLALAVWGDDAPRTAVRTVQVYVSRLRRALGDVQALVATPAGYCLRVRPGELDADRFGRLVEDGRRALSTGQAEHAADVLREALALWRGPALADLAYEPFAEADVARLEEQRLAAVQARVDADLAAGRHTQLVGELRQLVAVNPTREGLAGQLMIALYRCGQQTDALASYHAARRVLVDSFGVEPGPELRRLHEAILHHDRLLEWQAAAGELPQELDVATAPLVGRGAELAWLRERFEAVRTGRGAAVVVTGVTGIGKSSVVAELARDVHRQGAAVLYANGGGDPAAVTTAAGRAQQAAHATLLVVDDADQVEADAFAALAQLVRVVADRPVLALASGTDTNALARLGAEHALDLKPLDAEAVRAIVARYDPSAAGDTLPVERLLEVSGGVPRQIHDAASQWSRREAARRVDAVAGRAAAGRAGLRSIETELAGDVVTLQAALEGVDPDIAGTSVSCPFKGLAAFETGDAPYFFGRERLIAELVARFVGAPLLGIVGPSGSGKSSVLRAGLLPALASGVLPGSGDWAQAVMRPGEHPLRELRRALAGIAGEHRCVLAIDQFEETFTTCGDESERAAFIAELIRSSDPGSGHAVVVLAIRADYYGRCAAYPELSRLLAAGHVLVGPMRRDELRRAIEWPARRAGLRVDSELIDALLADVESELGGLPLLSACLLELWQRRDGRRLRYATYEQTGGVRGAVARLAEEAFSQLDRDKQLTARTVLLRLVAEGADDAVERRRVPLTELQGAHSQDVAHIVALLTDQRLLSVSGSGVVEVAHEALLREWPRLAEWIEQDREGLRTQRALTSAAVEWRRLGRDDAALYRGTLLTRTVEWRDERRPSLNDLEREFLSAGEAARSRERTLRRRRNSLVLTALTTGLIAAVVAAIFANHQRDVAQSRDLASRSLSQIAIDPGIALSLALEALGRSHTEQAQNALRQATLADRATHVVDARSGLLFGVVASPDGRVAATAGGDRIVRIWSVRTARQVGEVGGFASEVRAVSFSRDGRRLASAAGDGEIAVAAAQGGRRRIIARLPGRDFAHSIDFSTDGKTLVVGTDSGRVALVRVRDGALRDLSPRSPGAVFAVGFDARGRSVVSVGERGFAQISNVAGGGPLRLAHGTTSAERDQSIVSARFSPNGRRVATTDESGSVLVWDARSGREVKRIAISDKQQASVHFSGDGRRIVTAGRDGVIHVFEVRNGAQLARIRGHHGPARAAFVAGRDTIVSAGEEDGTLRTSIPPATKVPSRPGTDPGFDGNGRLIVSVDYAGAVQIWNPATGEDRSFAAQNDTIVARFSPTGEQIVSTSLDGTVRLLNVRSGRSRLVPTPLGAQYAVAIDPSERRIAIGGDSPVVVIQALDGTARRQLRGHRARVNALAFSPDAQRLLSASDDGTARIWNADDGTLERTLRGHRGVINDAVYSTDGRHIATAGSDGTVVIWPAGGGASVSLAGHEGAVYTAEFNDRDDRVVTAGDDGTIRIWNTAGGDALVVLDQHEGIATGADFGRGGRFVVSAGDDAMRVTPCEVCGDTAEVLRLARTRAQPRLTALQRRRLLPGG